MPDAKEVQGHTRKTIIRCEEVKADQTKDGPNPLQSIPVSKPSTIDAVVFDLDGILIDSEQVWDEARQRYAADHGKDWPPEATNAMLGMSSPEWSAYMGEIVGVDEPPHEINQGVLADMIEIYRWQIPFLPGAVAAVERIGNMWPLGLATSSNREIIDLIMNESLLGEIFRVTVSTEEVAAGKPAPDGYLEACRLLGIETDCAAAIEDSSNGLKSARAAGMRVIGIPNRVYPPEPDVLAANADVVLDSIEHLTPQVIAS